MGIPSYVYPYQKSVKVDTAKDTEPALMQLYGARHIRKERESKKGSSEDYIESIKEEIYLRAKAIRFQLYEIGRLLVDVKSLLPHGEFTPWLKDNIEFSESTALNCMRVYRTCMGRPDLVEHFKPSALYLICAPSFSADLRKALFEDASGVYDIDQKELLQTSIKYKKGEVTLESPEVQNFLKKQKEKTYFELYEIELKAIKQVLNNRLGSIKRLDEKQIPHPLLLQDQERDKTFFDVAKMVEGFIGEVDGMKETLKQIEKRKPKAEVIPVDMKMRMYMNRNRRKRYKHKI
jgi:Protein of unknown function (DUF3102)